MDYHYVNKKMEIILLEGRNIRALARNTHRRMASTTSPIT